MSMATRGEYMKSKYQNEDPDVSARDYGPTENPHEYHGFKDKKEEEDYWDKMIEMKEDDLMF